MRPLVPWLCMSGVEVANGVRTAAYLASCPGDTSGSSFQPPPAYTASGDCYCAAIDEGPYISPAEDDAPWFEASRPESGRFYGIILDSAEILPVIERPLTRLRNGGSVGPLRLKPLILSFSGIMWAGDANGMAYGAAWLEDALAGRYCKEGCSSDELRILLSCPDEELAPTEGGYTDTYLEVDGYAADPVIFGGATRFFRDAYRVGIADGPVYTEVPGLDLDQGQRVSFQLVAGVPWLFNALRYTPYSCQSIPNGDSRCALVTTASWTLDPTGWTRDATTVLQLEALDANVAESLVTVTATRSLDGLCPTLQIPTPHLTYTVRLRAGEILKVDGTTRSVTLLNPTTRRWESAFDRLTYEVPLQWMDVEPCTEVCVCVSNVGGTVKATLDLVPRGWG